jgi:hypothetical protein
VLFGTLITHSLRSGGRREGTAVKWWHHCRSIYKVFKLDASRKTPPISAGFACFWDPLRALCSALEIIFFSKISSRVFLSSFDRLYCLFHSWILEHKTYTHYIPIPRYYLPTIILDTNRQYSFGLTAMLFSRVLILESLFTKNISYPPLQPSLVEFYWQPSILL